MTQNQNQDPIHVAWVHWNFQLSTLRMHSWSEEARTRHVRSEATRTNGSQNSVELSHRLGNCVTGINKEAVISFCHMVAKMSSNVMAKTKLCTPRQTSRLQAVGSNVTQGISRMSGSHQNLAEPVATFGCPERNSVPAMDRRSWQHGYARPFWLVSFYASTSPAIEPVYSCHPQPRANHRQKTSLSFYSV